jgi:glyoxylase-like metal-dependent hydrolase (beta-lactamase superfamily II)
MRVKDNVYMLESTKGSYAYLIKGERSVLIDTSLSFKGGALLRELVALGAGPASIKYILVTHNDLDHVGNLARLEELTGAGVFASAADIPYITGERPRPGFKKTLSRIMRVKKPKAISALPEGGDIAGITVIETPGHTPGHVCFLCGGVLFAGDLVENRKGAAVPYPAPWTLDPAALLGSIKRVEEYDFEWVCPAHGKPYRRSGKSICGAV